MVGRVLVATAVFAGLVAADASAQSRELPPLGEPAGVYRGSVKIDGTDCRNCRVRIVLTEDGLEITSQSTVTVTNPRCSDDVVSRIRLARIRSDRSYRTVREDAGKVYALRGSVTRSRVTGRGRAVCNGRRLTFTARRVGHTRLTPGAIVRCEPLGRFTAKTIHLTAHRDLGCGLAHEAARGITGRVRNCRAVATGELEPAAQARCTFAGGTLEVVRLVNCTTTAMTDDEGGRSAHVHATPASGCAEAAPVGTYLIECAARGEPCSTPPGGYACSRDKALDQSGADRALRCTVAADPRKLLVVRFSSRAVV